MANERAMRFGNPISMGYIMAFALLMAMTVRCGNEVVTEPEEPDGAAGVYYVSNEGNDEADGAAMDTAFRTVGRALEVVGPGDTILVRPGTYHEALMSEGLGSPESPITIRGEGGTAILDGQNTMRIGFWCEQCSNLIFEALEIRNYTDVGIGVSLSSDLTMRNLVVHDNGNDPQLLDWEIEGYGIHAEGSSRVRIENNEVYRNGPQPTSPGRLGTGIDTFGLSDSVIVNNRSHDNIGGGILVEDGVQVVVEGNEVYGNHLDASADEWWDGGLWLDGGHDVTVRNNIFKSNQGPGIEISDEDHQEPYGYVLENNAVTENYYGIYIWNFGTSDLPAEVVLRMSDNQISGNARQDVWIVPWNCPPPEPCD